MHDGILDDLRAALGHDGVLVGDAIPEAVTHDWAGLPPVRPLAVLRPRSTGEVSAAMRLCHTAGVPVVPQGGRTGLAGGAHPVAGGVVLATDRLSGVIEIDALSATATVWAGTPLSIVQDAVEAEGLIYALDLGARGSCTVGGNLATNAGGNRVVRYGMTRDLVIGLEAVLADGTVVGSLSKMLKNNTGYDLRHLFVGSEGTLGVITRAVLKLHPRPLTRHVTLCGCADFDGVLALLRAARGALGPALSSFEVMWPDFYDFMHERLPRLRRPLTGRHGAYVLIEATGFDPAHDGERLEGMLAALLEQGTVADAVVARSEREVADLWAVRETVSEYGTLLGPITAFDVSFPIPDLQTAVDRLRAAVTDRWPGMIAQFFGHIGDGNIHVVAHLPGADPQPHAAIAEAVYEEVAALGGSVSAEHGIGTAKKKVLPLSRGEADLALMRRLKAAMDPHLILNPGKVL